MCRSVKWLILLLGIVFMFSSVNALIEFNKWGIELTDTVYYNGASYSALDETNFDYFSDSASAGEFITFIWDRGIFSGIEVNVSVPVNATTFNLAWEFYNTTSSSWQALNNVTDNTNNFTTAGVNNITWDVPDNAMFYTNFGGIGAADGVPIRSRISSVSGLTEGGRNENYHVIIRDYAIQITNQGNVRLSDIKTANDNGNWGVVENLNDFYVIKSNFFLGNISVGNAELIIKDNEILQVGEEYNRRIIMNMPVSGTRPGQHWRNNTIQMGVKTTGGSYGDEFSNGSTLIYWNNNGLSPYNYARFLWKIYASKIWKRTGGFTDIAMYPYYNSEFVYSRLETPYLYWYFYAAHDTNFTNTIVNVQLSSWFYDYAAGLSIDNLLMASGRGVLCGAAGVTTIENINFGADKVWSVQNNNRHVYWKNCIFNDFANQGGVGSTGSTSFEQYTFDLNIINQTGDSLASPNVTLIDAQNNTLWNSSVNGSWTSPLDIVTTTEISASQGGTVTYFNPLNITISYGGYQDYKAIFNLTQETDWLVVMGDYPFIIDGTLVIKQPENSVVIKKCS